MYQYNYFFSICSVFMNCHCIISSPSTVGIMCRTAKKKVEGLDDFHFHTLRHTYTSNFGKEKPPLWLYPYTAEYILTLVYFAMQTRLFLLLFVFFEYMFKNYMTTYNLKHHICTQIKNKYFSVLQNF